MKSYKTYKGWKKACEEVCRKNGREFICNEDESISYGYADGFRFATWNGVTGSVSDPCTGDYPKDDRLTFGQLWNYQLFPRHFGMERAKQESFMEACRWILKQSPEYRLMMIDPLTFSIGIEQEGWVEVGQIWK